MMKLFSRKSRYDTHFMDLFEYFWDKSGCLWVTGNFALQAPVSKGGVAPAPTFGNFRETC